MSSQDKLEEIILGCVKASRESQRRLYEKYYSLSMAIGMRYTNSQEEAEEIVNDSFLKIFNHLKNFEANHQNIEASFTAWVKKIVVHTAIDYYRKNKHVYSVELISDMHINQIDECEDILSKMAYADIISMIQGLSPSYRLVFNLYVLDGYKHEEIAKQLNISIGTSKSNLAKARLNIQKMIIKTNLKVYEERRAI